MKMRPLNILQQRRLYDEKAEGLGGVIDLLM